MRSSIGLALSLLLLIIGSVSCNRSAEPTSVDKANTAEVTAAEDTAASTDTELAEVGYEPPSRSGYLGNDACLECHQAICESYSGHPMSRSITPVDIAAER